MKTMPCPHCGKRDPLVDKYQCARVVCISCCTSGPLMPAEADAVRAWNRLAMAEQIAEAAWLREAALDADMEAIYCGQDPGAPARLFRCASDEMCRLLDEWGAMDGSQEGQP